MTDDGKPPSSDDVLEAIRRLVSGSEESEKNKTENAEAMTDSPKRDIIADDDAELDLPPQEDEPITHKRFVLTPSLRVLEDEDRVEGDEPEEDPSKQASDNQPSDTENARQLRVKNPDEAGAKPSQTRISEAQESLAAKIAALEAVIERQKIDWEPDGISEEDTLASAPLHEELSEDVPSDSLPVDPTLEEETLDLRLQDGLEEAEPVDDALDLHSADLQEQVAQIVRAELKGVLGEDITRSVRALVRREIERALTIRDLS